MRIEPGPELLDRLDRERIVWLCTLRRDGSPHLTPVWYVFRDDAWWIATTERTVKARNVSADPRVSLALPDGVAPIVAEGTAVIRHAPFPPEVVESLHRRYDGWDITSPDGTYVLLHVTVDRWLLTG